MSTFSGPGDYLYLHPEYSTVLALSLLLSVLSILLAHGRNNEIVSSSPTSSTYCSTHCVSPHANKLRCSPIICEEAALASKAVDVCTRPLVSHALL